MKISFNGKYLWLTAVATVSMCFVSCATVGLKDLKEKVEKDFVEMGSISERRFELAALGSNAVDSQYLRCWIRAKQNSQCIPDPIIISLAEMEWDIDANISSRGDQLNIGLDPLNPIEILRNLVSLTGLPATKGGGYKIKFLKPKPITLMEIPDLIYAASLKGLEEREMELLKITGEHKNKEPIEQMLKDIATERKRIQGTTDTIAKWVYNQVRDYENSVPIPCDKYKNLLHIGDPKDKGTQKRKSCIR